MEIQDIRNVPVENYLQALGYAPVRKSANELLYHSPLATFTLNDGRLSSLYGAWYNNSLALFLTGAYPIACI